MKINNTKLKCFCYNSHNLWLININTNRKKIYVEKYVNDNWKPLEWKYKKKPEEFLKKFKATILLILCKSGIGFHTFGYCLYSQRLGVPQTPKTWCLRVKR